jgi:dTDP-glucose 4,6-dehydratase
LVTGAAGFLGSHLSNRLLGEGHDVVGVDNLATGRMDNVLWLEEESRFTFVRQDVGELDVDDDFQAIFHLACPASPADFDPLSIEIAMTCALGGRAVLEAARRCSARVLIASTSECYGDPEVHPQPETYWGRVNTLGPRAIYDEGKRFAEALTMAYYRRYGLETRIVRIFNTYGPRMRINDGRVLPNFISQALRGDPLTVCGDGRQTRSFCFVDDEIEGILRVARGDFHEPINIGNPEEVSITELAHLVVETVGGNSKIEHVPGRDDDPRLRRPDISRAQEMLDWSPTISLHQGLARTVEDFKSRMDRTE